MSTLSELDRQTHSDGCLEASAGCPTVVLEHWSGTPDRRVPSGVSRVPVLASVCRQTTAVHGTTTVVFIAADEIDCSLQKLIPL